MRRPSLSFLCGVAAITVAALFALHENTRPGSRLVPPVRSVQDTEELLQGSWLREYARDGVKVRRVLVLAPGGRFRESVRTVDVQGAETRFEHEGTWLYDGTNLKRKYTVMNGRPPSRLNVPFATFEIAFETRNEFRGVDHIHRNKIHYRRVGADTAP